MVRSLACVVSLCTAGAVAAAPKPAALIGAEPVITVTAQTGFVDDPVASDGQRLAYVLGDSTKSELHVMTIATKQDQAVDISAVTLHPIALALVGDRALVIGQGDDGQQTATLVELSARGKVEYTIPAATTMTLIMRDGRQRLAVHRAVATKTGTRHDVQILALDTGRALASGHLELDATGNDPKLELHVNHWADGFSRAIGTKGGAWDPKENQRTPDGEATYDLATDRFIDKRAISDLFEQRKRYQVMADAGGVVDFVHMTWDNSAPQLWHNGHPKPVELDQAMQQYDPKSLQGIVAADGSAWIALKVDPVNPDAVARQKADPEYFDVFTVTADGKATRRARILGTNTRFRLGVIGDKFWLLERSNGFDRGGKSLTLYQLAH